MSTVKSKLKKGDLVMVIAGGHKTKRPNKGKVGKILRFVGEEKERVVVEGLNFVSRHQRARTSAEQSGKIPKEAPIHISNVRYYVEKLKKPVKLKVSTMTDGKKVRGYLDPSTKKFVQIA
jgi:large subunit ribosomal protein L24